MSISEAEKIAARKIVRDHIHTVLDFGRRAGVYWLMDGIDDIVDAALEAAERARWRPIETAPKDGTYVLVSWKGNPAVNRLQFSRRVREWVSEEGVGYAMPTHWQPLPSPPESK